MNKPADLLSASARGDQAARLQLDTVVYNELRELAASYLKRENPGHSLRPTGLVHEVYLKIIGQKNAEHLGRTHFFAIAAQAMRRILVDHARTKKRLKRGAGMQRVSFDEQLVINPRNTDDLLAVNDALQKLEAEAPDRAELVKLRYFAGMSLQQAAEVLGLSRTTAYRQWVYARAWLYRELGSAGD